MKTFDEAFEILTKNVKKDLAGEEDLFRANFMEARNYTNNKEWVNLIGSFAINTLLRIELSIEREEDIKIPLCHALHSIFQLGLLTGIEMEKSNETLI